MDLFGLGFLLLFGALIFVFSILYRIQKRSNLRRIPAFQQLRRAIDLAVEDGTRVHVSLGRADITGPNSAAALAALTLLHRVTQISADSDKPPVVTAGDGALAILSQDTLRSAYQSLGTLHNYSPTYGRAAGLTPFSYAAGTFPVIREENVSANLLLGTFGHELALISTAAGSKPVVTLAGSDSLPAQAILFATADEQLIGEEVYAAGAYVDGESMHIASLRAQDVIRWLLVAFILLYPILVLLNFA